MYPPPLNKLKTSDKNKEKMDNRGKVNDPWRSGPCDFRVVAWGLEGPRGPDGPPTPRGEETARNLWGQRIHRADGEEKGELPRGGGKREPLPSADPRRTGASRAKNRQRGAGGGTRRVTAPGLSGFPTAKHRSEPETRRLHSRRCQAWTEGSSRPTQQSRTAEGELSQQTLALTDV